MGNHGALEYLRHAELSSIQAKNGLPGERVTSLLEDHAGQLWVGVDRELYVYGDGKFRQVKHPKNEPLGAIIAITEDRDYTVWAEAVGNPMKLVRIQNGEVREEIPAPRVPAADSIAADPHEGIWLGLVNGDLARYRQVVASAFFNSLAAPTTCTPCAASERAVSTPSPAETPVTRILLPCRLISAKTSSVVEVGPHTLVPDVAPNTVLMFVILVLPTGCDARSLPDRARR